MAALFALVALLRIAFAKAWAAQPQGRSLPPTCSYPTVARGSRAKFLPTGGGVLINGEAIPEIAWQGF